MNEYLQQEVIFGLTVAQVGTIAILVLACLGALTALKIILRLPMMLFHTGCGCIFLIAGAALIALILYNSRG